MSDKDNTEEEEEIETIEAEPVEDDEGSGTRDEGSRPAADNRRSRRFVVWSLIVAGLLAAGTIYAAWPFITGKLAEQVVVLLPTGPNDGDGATNMKLVPSALERRLTTIEQTASESSRNIDEIRERIAEMSDALAAQNADPSAEVAELRERLAQVEKAIDALPAGGVTRDGAGVAALGQLQSRIDELTSKVETLSRDDAEADIQALRRNNAMLTHRIAALDEDRTTAEERIAQLEARLQQLETETDTAAEEARRPALLLAFLDLHREVTGGQPYATTLGVVEELSSSLSGAPADLKILRRSADRGVRTREALRQDFSELARRIVQAAAEPGDSVVGKTLAQLSKLVTVRRTGDVAGDTPQAIVARAEARLAEGNLAGAVEAIDRLQGEAHNTAAPWLEAARERLVAEEALGSLHGDIAAAVAGG